MAVKINASYDEIVFVLFTEKPYIANLQCVETFSGDKIDSAANGDILILARQMASTTFFLLCCE